MASYHLSVHANVSRGKGQSLVRSAAYNDRARLTDERTGEVWDYRHLGNALASGLYAPKGAPEWARDLGQLVNEVERFERRSDAQLAMNLDIALPHEQTLEQNRRLMQDFVREQFQRQGYAAHFAIHPPDRDGDQRNIHAHVLVTLRKIDEHGFARTKSEQQERYRNRGAYVEGLRDSWEQLANRHLERNGYDARIDRRSLAEQGIEREPQQHRGPAVTALERDGNVTRIGGEIVRRQNHYAELKALAAEERQIDAQIIDLQAARETRAAGRGQVDDIRPGSSIDLSASVDMADIQAAFTEALREAAQGREAPGVSAAPGEANIPTTAHEREPAPARDAPPVIHLGPPAEELTKAGREAVEIGGAAIGGLSDGIARMVEKMFDYLADFIAPPPPPTKEQAERMQQAAEERQAQEAAAREEAEKEALLQQLLDQMKRDDERRRYDRYTGRDNDYDRDDDYGYDRGRERER
jgi:MobA/MobL family